MGRPGTGVVTERGSMLAGIRMATPIGSSAALVATAGHGRSSGSRFRHVWLVYLLVFGSAIALYATVAGPTFRAAIFWLIDVGAVAAVLAGLRINRPSYRRPWTLVAIGSVLWIGGDLLSGLWPVAITAPIGGLDDLLALSTYVAISGAMLLLIRSRTAGRDRSSLIDASIVASAFGLLVWIVATKPLIGAASQSFLDELDAAIYPALDVFLLGIAVRLAIGAGRRPVSFWLILGSIGTLLLGDIGYAIQANGGLVGISGSLQIAWLASHLFASAAALHPSMRHLADRSDMPASRPLGWRWALASGAMLFGPAVLGIENVLGDPRPDIVPIMLAMLVISSLVLARVAGLIGDLRAAVSERERALVDLGARDRALLDSEGRFRRLVEIAAEGVWLVDPDWRTSFVNPRLAGMLGYEVDEMDGRPVADFVHPEFTDRFLAAQQRRMSGVSETYESCFRHRDGSDVWARLAATPILDADGGFGGAFAMVTDITEERRAELARIELEERLRQSQKMEAIGQLAGGVAHDLNNLLTVIGGHAELLKTSLALHNDAREDLDGIEDGVRRAVQVTRGLLAFARRSHLSPVVVGAEAVVADVVPLLRRFISEAISLEVELEAALPSILVDRSQLQHVILNLVLNARDAMPSGGRLTVAVARVEDPELGSSVEISVCDTGVGIAPERLPHIFEPFYTSKGPDRGTGLGLAIVDGIVAQSGGRTLVTSTPGEGSVFRVRLPVADGPRVEELPGPIHGAARAQGERILVVEDDDAVRGLLVRWLVHLGYEVSVADGPALGLEMARTTPIDLVISDVIMPGMSGPTMIEQLALHRPGLGVLFVSGYPEHAIFEQSAGLLPTDRLLHKPFSLDDLASAVRLALEGAR